MLMRVVFSAGIVFAVSCASAFAGGIAVGSSSLIDGLDYSDTFTWTDYGGIADRTGAYPLTGVDYPANGVPGEGLAVENCHGNPARRWIQEAAFSIATDATAASSPTNPYPGGSGADSDTGMIQIGAYSADFGFEYGLRDDFVVQFDAVQVEDRIDLVIGGVDGNMFHESCLSVFFRAADNSSAFPQIGIYNVNAGEHDTGFTSGIDTHNQWHNYAAHFDFSDREVEIFVDEQSAGIIDIDAFAGGAFASLELSAAYVNIGFFNMARGDRLWADNLQIGSPVPEPSALVLLFAGAIVLIIRRRYS